MRSVRTAMELAASRIRLLEKFSRARQNSARRQLRRIIRNLSEAGCLHLFGQDLTTMVDECKTNDANLIQLQESVKTSPEAFDNLSVLVPEQHELEKQHNTILAFTNTHEGAQNKPSIVLNYFLPGEFESNDSGAFVILTQTNVSGDKVISPSSVAMEPSSNGFANTKSSLGEVIIPLPDLHEAIKDFRSALKNARTQYLKDIDAWSEDEIGQLVHIPRLLSDLAKALKPEARHPLTGQNSTHLNNRIEKLESTLIRLGVAALPAELISYLKGFKHVTIVPDGRLFMLPVHVLPYSINGATLLNDGIAVSYKTRSDYGACWKMRQQRKEMFTYMNPTDYQFINATGMQDLMARLNGKNSWGTARSASDVLNEISCSKLSVVVAHGHASPRHEMASRIALHDGFCLTALDIIQSQHDFTNSSIFLFSCHSMPQRAAIGRELLGPAGAFLSKGVGCVGACIWKCRVEDAVLIANHLVERQPGFQDAPKIWSEALHKLSSQINCPLDRFMRLGCFTLYSSR